MANGGTSKNISAEQNAQMRHENKKRHKSARIGRLAVIPGAKRFEYERAQSVVDLAKVLAPITELYPNSPARIAAECILELYVRTDQKPGYTKFEQTVYVASKALNVDKNELHSIRAFTRGKYAAKQAIAQAELELDEKRLGKLVKS